MNIITCAICKTNNYTELLYKETVDFAKLTSEIFSARRIPDRVHYRLLKCTRCSLIFSSPILPEKDLRKLYGKSTVTYGEEMNSLNETYGKYLKKAVFYCRENPRLLEIGCGNGFFLEKAVELGILDVSGIEPGVESVKRAKKDIQKKIIVDFFPSRHIKAASKDIICIFQTLDHLIDPNNSLRACKAVLRKGGVVLCILHDTEGLSVRLLGERSPIFDVEHIFLFNKRNLSQIFVQNGFVPREVFSVTNRFPLRYWVRMFPLPHLAKKIILYALKTLGLSEILLSLPAGNIGIIAQKE